MKNIDLNLAKKVLAEKSLKSFIEQSWHIAEKRKPLLWNWHLDGICQHLEAVTNTYIVKSGLANKTIGGFTYEADVNLPSINYLWFNLPPRHTKSLIVGVFWPCWEWGPRNLPELGYIFSSYAQGLSTRDSIKRRRLMQSKYYQSNWGDRWFFTSDQNSKTRFDNDRTGHMIATSVEGMGTGEGGDRIIVDDPNSVLQIESQLKSQKVLDWWDDTMGNRINDDDTGAYIGVMQRTGINDLTGHMLNKVAAGEVKHFVHICLPAKFELNHPHPSRTPLNFKDPRTEDGQALDESRWPLRKLVLREGRMSSWAIAGQHQQRPAPKGGSIVPVYNIKIVDDYNPNFINTLCRYWDKAINTEGSGSSTASVLMATMSDPCAYDYIILDACKVKLGAGDRESLIRNTAMLDGIDVHVGVEQEPGSGGKESAINSIKKTLAGFKSFADRPTGAKEVRLEPFAAQVEHKNVAVLNRDWTKQYLNDLELSTFNKVLDLADATSGAFNYLAGVTSERKSKVRVRAA